MFAKRRTLAATLGALLVASLAGAALAQPLPWVGPFSRGWGPIAPGMMLGPATMGRAVHFQMCHPAVAGFAEWRIERVEQLIKPTEQQRGKFDELKAASAKAIEIMRDACPAMAPFTVREKLETMEQRLTVMLRAVQTFRAALDAFYATLSDEQRARLDTAALTPGFFRRAS